MGELALGAFDCRISRIFSWLAFNTTLAIARRRRVPTCVTLNTDRVVGRGGFASFARVVGVVRVKMTGEEKVAPDRRPPC